MKNKNKLNSLKKAYFKLPNRIHTIGLSATAIAIYSYMAKGPEDFNPSVGNMSKALKLSKTTVVKYIKELKNRNIVKVIQPGAENLITKYEFVEIEKWIS